MKAPFRPANPEAGRKLKCLLIGGTGAGKTTLALQFPKPVMIDLDGGSLLYESKFPFDVARTADADDVEEWVRWLLQSRHEYQTLIVDPISVHWEASQAKWSSIFLAKRPGSKGHQGDFYDIQMKDWVHVRSDTRRLIRMLTLLDMNVVLTARVKPQYGSNFSITGETYDGEKSLPYLFDVIIKLWVDGQGKHWARVEKDRTGQLPSQEKFEPSLLLQLATEGEVRPVPMASEEDVRQLMQIFRDSRLPQDQIDRALRRRGVEKLDELTAHQVQDILKRLQHQEEEDADRQLG